MSIFVEFSTSINRYNCSLPGRCFSARINQSIKLIEAGETNVDDIKNSRKGK